MIVENNISRELLKLQGVGPRSGDRHGIGYKTSWYWTVECDI